ncbi:MAG TPA: cation-translocating P-type ATPase [Gemmataceae bacterium]|nr:cation-translocating P-type ATPase [Gemmataceae bacterium]
MRTISDIEHLFPGAAENGLSSAAAAQSVHQFGANKLTPLPREPLWKKFLEKFDEPIIKILLGAALLSMFVDLFQSRPGLAGMALAVVAAVIATAFVRHKGHWVPSILFVSALVLFFVGLIAARHPSVEGLAVMVAVILATGVAFLSEYKSDREFEVLNAHKDSLTVKVLRDGAIHTVPMEQVCVGDVVVLEVGDEVPADGRLVKATDLYIDQSLMTGESEPVRKRPQPPQETSDGPDQPGCLYRGTQVVDGVGQMLVSEVGDATALGQIARRLSAEEEEEEEPTGETPVPPGETPVPQGETEEKRVKRKLTISKELTPLQVKLKNLADLISNVGYIAALAIFLALVGQGLYKHDLRWYPERPAPLAADEEEDAPRPMETRGQALLSSSKALLNYFVYMVIIIVVAVPEGLPMSVTVSLALAMRKMTRANSLVRQLVACETIGSATVICSDKTGTLTQNKMQVVRVFWDGRVHDRGSPEWPRPASPPSEQGTLHPLDWIVLNAALNSTANLEEKQGKLVTVGNSTEGALLHWLHEAGLEYQKLRLQYEPLYQMHFSSERKRMTTVVQYGDRLVSLVKGAPEWLLERSTHYQAADGSAREWTTEARASVQACLKDSAGQAMRTLGFGYAILPPGTAADEDALHARRDMLESGLVFVGFLAIRDPLRDDVKDAVEQCRRAGIEVKMITGDNVETARAIAYDIGLIDRRDAPIDEPDAVVLTSPKFNELHAQLVELKKHGELAENDTRRLDDLARQLAGLRVLARARPLDKYKMVELLQERQQVVAVTGDGTNDAPALKKADVGLAMGIAGTEVAKEASKIVLLDDAFSTIVKAVHWGRSLYENIQRFIQFQLTINVSALTIAFLGPFFGVRPPFTVLQLLWINVIMDTFASIALCSEPPRPGLMNMPPKRKDENIVTQAMMRTIFATATFFVLTMMILLIGMQHFQWFAAGSGDNPENWDFGPLNIRQVSIFFTVYIFFQVWNQINCRSLTPDASGLSGILNNPTFLMIAGTVAVVQVLIISVPWLGRIFKVEPLSILDWLCILVGTASVLLFAEIARRIRMAMAPSTGVSKG